MTKEIDSVRIYQAVQFEKVSETFFSTRKLNNKVGREIKINKDLGGVEISSEKDHILVPFTNVSCIYFKSQIKVDQEKRAEKEKSNQVKNSKAHRDTVKRPK